MKKLILTSFAALMFTAAADASFYISGYVRTGSNEDVNTVSAGYTNQTLFDITALDATVGYSFKNGLRLEADVFSMNLDPNFGNFSFNLGMARALYDIKVNDKIVPYFGVGIGQAGWESVGTVESLGFMGSLVGGVAFYVADNVAIDLQYSRLMTATLLSGNSQTVNYSDGANEVRLGMRYHF